MILRKKKKQYESPGEGSHLAVLVDIEDLGEKQTPWAQQQRQIRFRWFVQQLGKDGKQLSVIGTYNASLNENSNLVQVITDITGMAPDDGFDTETLVGANARLTIKHHITQNGSVFPKIVAILPPGKGDQVLRIPSWYKRGTDGNHVPAAAAPRTPANNESVVGTPSTEPIDNPDLPPEPNDLDAGDHGTSFPGDENAA